ncbi:membrane protein [Phytophthora palmivora]|uniref:Membrane protein n=1 Tax=Phytophthora palmivora TaxID=4796 RepID=A0A2P4YKE9_9STRA|nr:membrane protein [Phytophthora palmivora]
MVLVGQFAARQLCMGLGYIYPLYASVEALRTRQQQELLQWITFWTVNALFWVVETVGDTIISWVPFYLEAKIVALAWLVLPSYRGALLLHQKWLAPAFQQHEEVIDFTIADFKRRAGEKMVQVCKDTAVIALRNSSDVVAQSQQFVAAQLVQQALGKLQIAASVDNIPSDGLRQPSLLSPVATATTVISDKAADSKRETHTSRQEMKSSKTESKSVFDPQEKSVPTTLSRTEKAKQVLDHFKKLMVKGFQLKYHPSAGVVKNRVLLLESTNSRYVSFMSARDTGSVDNKKKAARLLLHNLRRVSASTADECALFAKMVEEEEVDAANAFILDNGKAVMLFEAESEKSRDLLVAGLRLLINEHKKRDTAALNMVCAAVERIMMHHAFTQLRATNAGRLSRK